MCFDYLLDALKTKNAILRGEAAHFNKLYANSSAMSDIFDQDSVTVNIRKLGTKVSSELSTKFVQYEKMQAQSFESRLKGLRYKPEILNDQITIYNSTRDSLNADISALKYLNSEQDKSLAKVSSEHNKLLKVKNDLVSELKRLEDRKNELLTEKEASV